MNSKDLIFASVVCLIMVSAKAYSANVDHNLTWYNATEREDSSPLNRNEIAGNTIYFGSSSGSYPNSIFVAGNNVTSYTRSNVPDLDTYYVLTTKDTGGRESQYSAEVKLAGTYPPSKPFNVKLMQLSSAVCYVEFEHDGKDTNGTIMEWLKFKVRLYGKGIRGAAGTEDRYLHFSSRYVGCGDCKTLTLYAINMNEPKGSPLRESSQVYPLCN